MKCHSEGAKRPKNLLLEGQTSSSFASLRMTANETNLTVEELAAQLVELCFRDPMPSLPDRYDFAAEDPAIYKRWMDAGCFGAAVSNSSRMGGSRDPYTIVMPPPNVTAILHVGHGLNNT